MANPLAYRLIEISAAGTFGTVCVAQDLDKGRLVALKVLKESHLHRPRVLARTRDEANLMAQLNDPHIVGVDGLVTIEDRPVLVLDAGLTPGRHPVVQAFTSGRGPQRLSDAINAWLPAEYPAKG